MALKSIYGLDYYPARFYYDMPFSGADGSRQNVGNVPDFVKKGMAAIKTELGHIDAQEFVPNPGPLCHWCVYCGTYPDQPKEAKFLCPYYSLWTRENKTFKVASAWLGPDRDAEVVIQFRSAWDPDYHGSSAEGPKPGEIGAPTDDDIGFEY